MKRLLLCTDGSSHSQVAAHYAAWFANRLAPPARIEALYVTDLRKFQVPMLADLGGSLGLQPYQDVMGRLEELEKTKAEAVLADAERCLRDAGFAGEIRRSHATGFLVDRLAEFERDADLVLLGKRGENADYAAGHLGSTMERAVRSSLCPCLVSPGAFREIRRVLLAFDGSPSSRKALEHLLGSALFRPAELHVVIVARRNHEEEALGALREAESALLRAGLHPVCQMLHGAVEDEIAGYVESRQIDALLMGAYGHGRVRHLVIGSATTDLLRQCDVPVLVFR